MSTRPTAKAPAQPWLSAAARARASAADHCGRIGHGAAAGRHRGGGPLIGYLGHNVTVLRAVIAIAVVLALATLVTGALRPLPAHSPSRNGGRS